MVENINKTGLDFPQPIKELTKSPVKRVLLINPNHGGSEGFQVPARTEPLGLEYVAGAITDLVQEVKIHDDSSRPGGWKEAVNNFSPDLIGISCNYTVAVPEVRRLTNEISSVIGENIPIIIGGHAISLRPNDLYVKGVKGIVIGKGEEPFRNVVKAWGEKRSIEEVENVHYRRADGEFVSNVRQEKPSGEKRVQFNSPSMDRLPSPRRDLADPFRDTYYLLHYPNPQTLRTADGCTHRCTFCSGHRFNKETYRSQSPEKTIKEIELIPDGSYVLIPDDFAFLDMKAWNQIADYLIQTHSKRRFWGQTRADLIARHPAYFAKLAEAGFRTALVGFEAFDPADLKEVGKGVEVAQNIQYNLEAIKVLKENKISIWGAQILFQNFIRGNFLRLAEFNNEKEIEHPQFAIFTPLPATELYEKQLALGNLTGNEDPREFDLFSSVLPTVLPKERFYAWRDYLYLHTGYIPTSRIKGDIEAGFTTMAAVRQLRDRIKQAYDTPRYRELMEEEKLRANHQEEPIEIFSASDIRVKE